MRKVSRVGVIGLGHIGKKHMEQYRTLGLEVFTADPRTDEQTALALGSAGHFADCETMLETSEPDAVSVCLPSYLHKDGALSAFRVGADVLMEKPFALTLEEIDEMLLAAQTLGHRIMVAHVCRFMPQYQIAKELIDSRRLGKPVLLNAWRLSATPCWFAQNWLGDKAASGGTVMDLQIHEIDLALWLLGPVRDAALTRRQSEKLKGSGFCHAVSALGFMGGAAAVLEAGHLMPVGYELNSGYRLVLENGSLEFELAGREARMLLHEDGQIVDLTQQYVASSEGCNPYLSEIMHFVTCLETGEEFRVKAHEARSAVAVGLGLANKGFFRADAVETMGGIVAVPQP